MNARVAHHLDRARALCTIACAATYVDGESLRLFIEVVHDELEHTRQAIHGQSHVAGQYDPVVGDVFNALDGWLIKAQETLKTL